MRLGNDLQEQHIAVVWIGVADPTKNEVLMAADELFRAWAQQSQNGIGSFCTSRQMNGTFTLDCWTFGKSNKEALRRSRMES